MGQDFNQAGMIRGGWIRFGGGKSIEPPWASKVYSLHFLRKSLGLSAAKP